MNFGGYIKELRIGKRLTLRQCCAELGVDPSNWSKMEREITPPPKDLDTLERWADFFGVESVDRQEFTDKAALARAEIPPDVAADERVLEALPILFRAARNRPLEGDRLKDLIENVRALHSPDAEP